MKRRKRIELLVMIAVAAFVAVSAYVELKLWRPIGKGPAGPAVPREAFDQIWSDQQVQVIGLGDSITAGLGAKSIDHSYFNRLLQNPEDEFSDMDGVCLTKVLPNLSFENFAISGSESDPHLQINLGETTCLSRRIRYRSDDLGRKRSDSQLWAIQAARMCHVWGNSGASHSVDLEIWRATQYDARRNRKTIPDGMRDLHRRYL